MLFQQKFGKANVASLVERVSRFTELLVNANKTTARVMGKLADVMRALPFAARKSVTFDPGSEFMDWPAPAGRGRHTDLVLRSVSPVAK